jgi:hypothetical protein
MLLGRLTYRRFAVWSTTRYLFPPIWCVCCSAGPLLEAGSPSGTKSWARSVSVPIALLRSSSRSGSVFTAFEVTTFGYRRGKTCRERAISLMSRLTPIYTIRGLLSTTSGLGVRHTGPAGRTVGSTVHIYPRRPQGRPPQRGILNVHELHRLDDQDFSQKEEKDI